MRIWKRLKEEERGNLGDKIWLINEKGEVALFKPYNDYFNPRGTELTAYRTALALGIPCAKAEEFAFEGVDGVLSYDVHEKGFAYCHGGTFLEKTLVFDSSGAAELSIDDDEPIMSDVITMETIRTDGKYKPLENGVVEMIFFDFIDNCDRHGGNWEIKIAANGEIAGLAPLYDNGLSLTVIEDEKKDVSLFYWDDKKEKLSHYAMFANLCACYPERVGELLEKCRNVELPEFCRGRVGKMSGAYSDLNRGTENAATPRRRR